MGEWFNQARFDLNELSTKGLIEFAKEQVDNAEDQATQGRGRGYLNTATFACIIYLLGAPINAILDVFHST